MAREPDTSALSDDAGRQRAAWRAFPLRLFLSLATLDTLLVLAYFALIALGRGETAFFAIFNLDKEGNLPSWYAGMQLFIIAVGYFVLGSRLVPDRRRTALLRPLWLVLGLGFTVLSADEISGFHERMGRTLWRMKVFNIRFTDQWMVVYILIAAVLALLLGKQLLRVWREWRFEAMLFLLGFGVLASGAFLAEVAQIYRKWQGFSHLLEIGLEEWLEMFGATILILPAYRILSTVMSSDPDPEADAVRAD